MIRPELAMCLGGADCVWDDVLTLEALYGRRWDGLVIAANDVGCHWPRDLHHWVSLHPDKFPAWTSLRQTNGLSNGYRTWGRMPRRRENPRWDEHVQPWQGGSSGMLAVQVALEKLGCIRIVLCGVPLTPTPHFAETCETFGREWRASAGHWRAWPRELPRLQDKVKSMSGRTQELLGAPTLEWLTRE